MQIICHRRNESKRLDPARHPATNIVAEIMAITQAFDTAGIMGIILLYTRNLTRFHFIKFIWVGAERLAVHTDSMFIIDCFEQRWIHNWLSNGWIKTDGGPAIS